MSHKQVKQGSHAHFSRATILGYRQFLLSLKALQFWILGLPNLKFPPKWKAA